jgi:hypothetical protein
VTDNLGRPIAGATVTDGVQRVTAAADGSYKLDEGSTGQYTLRAYNNDGGTASQQATVVLPVPTTIDFTPGSGYPYYYRVTSNVTPSTVSTADAARTLTLNVQTTAPTPASACVRVRDSRTNQVGLASFASASGTTSSWTYSVNLAQGTPQNSYTLTSWVVDCPGGAPGAFLSNPSSNAVSGYTVDNTAPSVDPKSVIPLDNGNTAFVVQPLSAVVTDTGGAGVSQSSIRFDLVDTSPGNPDSPRTFTNVPYNSSTRRATLLNPGALTLGHSYSLTVNVSDGAGNPAAPLTTAFGVLKVEPTADPITGEPELPTAVIPPTVAASFTDSGLERTFTFKNIPLELSGFDMQVTGTPAHAGYGYVEALVDLSGATITLSNVTTVNGRTTETDVASVSAAAWPAKPVLTQWRDVNPPGTANPVLSVTNGQWAIDQLTFTTMLPANKATVRLSTDATVRAPVCANPTAACGDTNYPTPDPMPFYFSPTEAGRLAEGERTGQQSANDAVAQQTPGSVPCDTNDSVGEWESCAMAVPSQNGLTQHTYEVVYNPLLTDDYGAGAWDILAGAPVYYGVLYGSGLLPPIAANAPTQLNTAPLFRPADYATECVLLACTSARASANDSTQDPGDTRTDCINKNSGINEDGGKCYQYATFTMRHMNAGHVTSGGTWETDIWRHHFLGTMKNTKGWHNADEDNFALATNQDIIGRDFGASTKVARFKKETLNPGDPTWAHKCYTTQVWEGNGWRRPTTNSIDMVDMKQGKSYFYSCDEYAQSSKFAWTQLTYAEIIWRTDTCVTESNVEGTCDGTPKRYNDGATAFYTYGHKKRAWSGQWSCGANVPAQAGCSYGGQMQDENHWERPLRDMYSY